MRQTDTLYYLLFVLLIFGGFASMAQNDYGITILGIVSSLFGVIFLLQLAGEATSKVRTWSRIIELGSVTILSAIMAMRVFHIHFQFVELIFAIAGISLILVFLLKIWRIHSPNGERERKNKWPKTLFYSSIFLYTFSMVAVAFLPPTAEPSGGAAFALLILFLLLAIFGGGLVLDGEKVSLLKWVRNLGDTSPVLMTLYVIFSFYLGLTKFELLPKMYSNEFPQGYFELVNRAETGREKPVNGKYKHEVFKESYDRLVKRKISK